MTNQCIDIEKYVLKNIEKALSISINFQRKHPSSSYWIPTLLEINPIV